MLYTYTEYIYIHTIHNHIINQTERNVTNEMSKVKVLIRLRPGGSAPLIKSNRLPVLDADVPNEEVFKQTLLTPLREASVDRESHLTLMCYGPTGAGKTHTLFGSESLGVFDYTLAELKNCNFEISCVELYNDEFRDLIGNSKSPKLVISDQRFVLKDVTKAKASDAKNCREILSQVLQSRRTRETAHNATSSRSHLLVTLSAFPLSQGFPCHITFVDLAGSERLGSAAVKQAQIQETISINRSLFFLTEIVARLSQGAAVVPFRYCKLTQMLSTPLQVGNHVAIVVNLSAQVPTSVVKGALRFALKAAAVKVTELGEIASGEVNYEVSRLRREIARLREENRKLLGSRSTEASDGFPVKPSVVITAADPKIDALIERLDRKREQAAAEASRVRELVLAASEGRSIEGDGDIENALRKVIDAPRLVDPELQKARETIVMLKRLLKERSAGQSSSAFTN